MPITFKNTGHHWPTSAQIRENYAKQDQPLLLSFSRGKDSIAAWLAMLDSGIKPENIHPIYYYRVPDLEFTEKSLQRYEDYFQTHITRLPHPALYAQLYEFCLQPIRRVPVIAATDIETHQFQDLEDAYRIDNDLPDTAYACTGVRAADGIARRTYMKRFGPITDAKQKTAIIWDWTKQECYDRIAAANIPLEEWSPDYAWFKTINPKTGKPIKNSGRTFDGLSIQFLEPLQHYAPHDFEKLCEWYPLAPYEIKRHHLKDPQND